jgi:histidinol-phosphate aminotransferase
MSPYVSARSGAGADGGLLNANEAPHSLLADKSWTALDLHRYPPPQPAALRSRLAGLYDVEDDQLLVTRGSDEGIDLLLRVFCRPGQDAIMEATPCFGMYRVAAQIQAAKVVQVARDPRTLEVQGEALLSAIEQTAELKLLFLTSPNNPTGDVLPPGLLEQVLEATRGRALVVLDEAYIEFCRPGAATRLQDHPEHLVVLRTLSKAWGAAGLRCGAVLANPAVVQLLARVMAPYPLTAPAIAAALSVTSEEAQSAQGKMLQALRREKNQLIGELAGAGWVLDLWPGEANFVLIRVENGPALVRHCAQQGVRIRDFHGQPLLDNCVRLTIGSASDMAALRGALDSYEPAS